MTKTIKYNNKEYKLPFDVELPEDPTVEVEVKNRFTGEATTMPEFALRSLREYWLMPLVTTCPTSDVAATTVPPGHMQKL